MRALLSLALVLFGFSVYAFSHLVPAAAAADYRYDGYYYPHSRYENSRYNYNGYLYNNVSGFPYHSNLYGNYYYGYNNYQAYDNLLRTQRRAYENPERYYYPRPHEYFNTYTRVYDYQHRFGFNPTYNFQKRFFDRYGRLYYHPRDGYRAYIDDDEYWDDWDDWDDDD